MVIEKPVLNIINDEAQISVQYSLDSYADKKNLWFSVKKEYGKYLVTERLDRFLLALLYVAMERQENIYVKGAVSEKFYYNLTNYIIPVVNKTNASLKIVKIIPDSLDHTHLKNKGGCGAGFTGGIDSFSVLYDHFYDPAVPKSYKITHLFFNNVWPEKMVRYNGLLSRELEEFAHAVNLPFIIINSNLYEHLDVPVIFTHELRNIAAALIFQKLISKYYFASGYPYEETFIGENPSSEYSQPVKIPLLSTENFESILAGPQYSRIEKTELVSKVKDSYKYLHVCTDEKQSETINCGKCFKCLRTLLTLELLGAIANYDKIFNLKNYYKFRKGFIAKTLVSDELFEKEITNFARKKGHKFPIRSRLLSFKLLMFAYQSVRIPTKFILSKFKSSSDRNNIPVINKKHELDILESLKKQADIKSMSEIKIEPDISKGTELNENTTLPTV